MLGLITFPFRLIINIVRVLWTFGILGVLLVGGFWVFVCFITQHWEVGFYSLVAWLAILGTMIGTL